MNHIAQQCQRPRNGQHLTLPVPPIPLDLPAGPEVQRITWKDQKQSDPSLTFMKKEREKDTDPTKESLGDDLDDITYVQFLNEKIEILKKGWQESVKVNIPYR